METSTEIEVRYAETDGMGVVYHANYLVYLEVARTDFLNKLGFPYADIEKAGYLSPVVHVDLSYGLPFRYGDTVVVKTHVTAVTSHCVCDKETFKPVSQKKLFPELFEAYKRVCYSE